MCRILNASCKRTTLQCLSIKMNLLIGRVEFFISVIRIKYLFMLKKYQISKLGLTLILIFLRDEYTGKRIDITEFLENILNTGYIWMQGLSSSVAQSNGADRSRRHKEMNSIYHI